MGIYNLLKPMFDSTGQFDSAAGFYFFNLADIKRKFFSCNKTDNTPGTVTKIKNISIKKKLFTELFAL